MLNQVENICLHLKIPETCSTLIQKPRESDAICLKRSKRYFPREKIARKVSSVQYLLLSTL